MLREAIVVLARMNRLGIWLIWELLLPVVLAFLNVEKFVLLLLSTCCFLLVKIECSTKLLIKVTIVLDELQFCFSRTLSLVVLLRLVRSYRIMIFEKVAQPFSAWLIVWKVVVLWNGCANQVLSHHLFRACMGFLDLDLHKSGFSWFHFY